MPEIAAASLDREGIILLLAAGAQGPFALDPIRTMKGCFIVSQRGRPEWRSLFQFEAYDYGPFDRSVYVARDALIARGDVAVDSSGRYESYSLTDAGSAAAERMASTLDSAEAEWLHSVGRYVCSKSFSALLTEIYGRFPAFATRSVARLS
jgi:hypothetical protein